MSGSERYSRRTGSRRRPSERRGADRGVERGCIVMPLVRKALVIGLILVLLSYAWYARSGARPTIPAPLQLKIEEKHRVELEVAALTQKAGLLSAQNAKLRANLVAAGRAVPPRIAAAMVTVPVVAPVVTHSFMTTASGCIVEDGRLRGVDIKTVPMPLKIGSTNDCCESCRMHLRMHLEACSLWTYDKVKKQCWLKSKAEPVTEADRAVRNWLFGNMNHLLKPPPPPPVDVLGNPVSDGILRLNPPWMESSVSAVSPLGPSSPQQPAAATAAPDGAIDGGLAFKPVRVQRHNALSSVLVAGVRASASKARGVCQASFRLKCRYFHKGSWLCCSSFGTALEAVRQNRK